jgi:D-alanyl-D-alanine carboxypeptidase/D-alanyl-D-alanine-endopeptidase (penicillin-binding protein 4)
MCTPLARPPRATRRPRRHILAGLLVLGLLALDAAARPAAPGLGSAIEARLAKAAVPRQGIGIVWAARGAQDTWLKAGGADQLLIPASTAKLFTAAAALDLLGPGAQLVTRLEARGGFRDGVLAGDLVVHGDGDPSVGDAPAFGATPLDVPDRFAAAVAAAGIRRVTGAVVVDDLLFDEEHQHATWTDADRRAAYGAGVASITLNRGCMALEARGSARDGQAAELQAPTGTGVWTVTNRVTTALRSRPALHATWDGNTLVVGGEVPVNGRGRIEVPVPQPALLFAGALQARLRARGVVVDGAPRRARDEADAARGTPIAQHATSLGALLAYMLPESENVYASTLFKRCGVAVRGRGTWASGELAVATMLERRGIELPGMAEGPRTRILDGSGLSPGSRTTARTLVDLLSSFDRDLVRGPLLRRALPTNGEEGTMRRRLKDKGLAGRIHAKTGTLNDVRVRALAGYVDGEDGQGGHVFAILLNGGVTTHGVIDDVVRLLAASR